MNLRKLEILSNRTLNNLLLTLLSALLMSSAWVGIGAYALFVALVPMLFIAERENKKTTTLYMSLMLSVWVLITESWIANAAVIGVVMGVINQLVLFNIPMLLYCVIKKHATRTLAVVVFISAWLAMEHLYMHNSAITHPWILLGTGFATSTRLVQFYEYTGIMGGGLWVLVVNFLVFRSLREGRNFCAPLVMFLLPAVGSLIMYFSYEETGRDVKVTVVQPNLDPYKEKFSGVVNEVQLLNSMMREAPKDVDYILAPETYVRDNINIDAPTTSSSVRSFQKTLTTYYPCAHLIVGASMYRLYEGATSAPTATATKRRGTYSDSINGSLQLGAESTDAYIKSRLVLGVESIPFLPFFTWLQSQGIDFLQGRRGLLTTQKRNVFTAPTHQAGSVKVAAPICYESVYGEFMGGFMREGAELIFIITNDGWWGDTFGYKQHFNYARLRAIEARRAVARSANTGISGFINQRGDKLDTLGWDERGTLSSTIKANSTLTFYNCYGDYISRAACYVLVLSLLYFVSYIYKKKSNLN